MAKQPENSPEKPNFFLAALAKYGRYLWLPNDPVAEEVASCWHTITIWERLELIAKEDDTVLSQHHQKAKSVSGQDSEVWYMRRVEPSEPINFLAYQRRKN
jgi:hypothetical protein